MSTPRVVRIPILPFGMVNAHLVIGERGAILVDAGLPGSAPRVLAALRAAGLGPSDLRLIVITHAHIDHAGEAAAVRARTGAPILGHAADAPYFRGDAEMTLCPSGVFGRFFRLTGLIQRPYPRFTPDILLADGDTCALDGFGVSGVVRHTPGHTAGSLTVSLGSVALVGDMVASGLGLGGIAWVGTAKSPPFEEDPLSVARELDVLVQEGTQRFYLGHGGPLPGEEVARHAATLSRRFRQLTTGEKA